MNEITASNQESVRMKVSSARAAKRVGKKVKKGPRRKIVTKR
jgi:hypothetical protein